MANWDLAGAWACLTGMPVTTVAERLRPESLYDRFVGYREQLGMEVIALTGGGNLLGTLRDALRRGRLVCLLADRDLTGSGVEVDLLGETARLPGGPGRSGPDDRGTARRRRSELPRAVAEDRLQRPGRGGERLRRRSPR